MLDHHRPDGRFRNPSGSPRRQAKFMDMLRFFGHMFTDRTKIVNPPGHALAFDLVQSTALAAPNPSVTWLGHAAFLIRTGGKVILTDPFLGEVAGPAGFGPRRHVPPALPVQELPKIDILLVSHNHYGHLDRPTLKELPGKDQTQVLVPLGLAKMFRDMGFTHVHELDWWQDRQFDGVRVQLQPAVHFSGRSLRDRNKTLWGSFGIYADDARMWFSGDTTKGEVFKEIGERAGPFDLAMVGIGAYEPQIIMQSSHATPEEAIGILQDIRARQGIGMHWGTIRLTPEPPFEAPGRFKAAARAQGYGEDNAVILKIGGTYPLAENSQQAAE